MSEQSQIGFIGQGWIGKNYADYFENAGYSVVKYSLEPQYVENKDAIKSCDIVFIAVPTPTTPSGFDCSIVEEAVKLVGKHNVAVIKSTVTPGTTERIQQQNENIYVLHSPEFLTEVSAAHDVAHPFHNIVGIPVDSDTFRTKAGEVMSILPRTKSETICSSRTAELFKYLRNNFLLTKYIFMNVYYDMAAAAGADWGVLQQLMASDPWIGSQGTMPVHKGGRGVGGHCHIKDLAAARLLAQAQAIMPEEIQFLCSLEQLNKKLLTNSKKDLDLLRGVYGDI